MADYINGFTKKQYGFYYTKYKERIFVPTGISRCRKMNSWLLSFKDSASGKIIVRKQFLDSQYGGDYFNSLMAALEEKAKFEHRTVESILEEEYTPK